MANSTSQLIFKPRSSIRYGGKIIDITVPKVMGIINITPDSFYKESRYTTEIEILKRAEEIQTEGGTIVDIGGASSRPGAAIISEKEELNRLIPAFEAIKKYFPDTYLSVDTFRSNVARYIIEKFGDCIINDITAGESDPDMFNTIACLKVPYIMMHMKGTPQTMQNSPEYVDVVADIISYFVPKVIALNKLGISDIILDPGFGFGKTLEHNFQMLLRLDEFRIFELPILAGISRKSMISKLPGINSEGILSGTIALNTIALLKGTGILRVHDVKEAVATVTVAMKYLNTLNIESLSTN